MQIMIHSNIADLKKHISSECLPSDYGGSLPKTSEELTGESYSDMSITMIRTHLFKVYLNI